MTAAQVLENLRLHGVQVERHGDRLRLRAAHEPPAFLLAEVANAKPELLAVLPDADRPRRPVLHFRLASYGPNSWATSIGRPNESLDELRADMQDRFGSDLVETREPGATPRPKGTP